MIGAKLSARFQSKEIASLPEKEYNVLRVFLKDFYWLTRIPIISILVLIVCLIRTTSMSLVALFKEISFSESASSEEMIQLIMKWRKSYILVRDLVAEMNAFFCRPIIIIVFISMLSSINLTFSVIIKIKTNNFSKLFDYILEILTYLICVTILVFISEQIAEQVS